MSRNDFAHRFEHQAMGTIIELHLAHKDASYAAAAAAELFRLIDRLEQLLSRYRPNSDISRINALQIGGSARVSLETFECLQQCRELFLLTSGVFDVSSVRGCLLPIHRSSPKA